MRSRRQARESALQALYQCDTLNDWSSENIDLFFERFTSLKEFGEESYANDHFQFSRALVEGVATYLSFIDRNISCASLHWNIARMSRVDRNILRMAVFELAFLSDIPASVTINEAIEVAKRFGSDDSPMFVNGVLDRLASIFEENPGLVNEVLDQPLERRKAVNE